MRRPYRPAHRGNQPFGNSHHIIMATVKIKFRASSVATREGTLVYRVIHKGATRQFATRHRLYAQEWDDRRSEVTVPPETDDSRRSYLAALRERTAAETAVMKEIIAALERSGRSYTADEVTERYRSYSATDGFVGFARRLIAELRLTGRERTAERYATVLKRFERFIAGGPDVPLGRMDADLMAEYEVRLKADGICPNSSSFYMRGLRAIYNRAVERGLTVQRNPFRSVYTGIGKTVKRAVPLEVVRRIRDLDLRSDPATDYARDLFMFSFYTRGMSFIDMAYLKKSDLRNGILTYRRQKTGQRLSVKWERPMHALLEKYDTRGTPYLLPVIRDMGQDGRRQYRAASHFVNVKLKKMGERLGLAIPLTMYVARHGWASIARSKNVPISVISEAMGHDSEKTTQIYLASLDTSAVDKANSIILKAL